MSLDIWACFSVIVAVSAAVFAWKSADAARKQNTIARQAALLEYLLQKSSKIAEMRIEAIKVQEWVYEHLAPNKDKFKNIDKIDKDMMESLIVDLKRSQQKATNVIFCYHHYFKFEDWSKLRIWFEKLEKCNDLSGCLKMVANSPLIALNCVIIPTMLEDIEKDILSIEQKLRENI